MNILELQESARKKWFEPFYDFNTATPETDKAAQEVIAGLAGMFSLAEVMALCDILNSTLIDLSWAASFGDTLAVEIAEGCRYEGLDGKWKFSKDEFTAKLRSLNPTTAWGLAYTVKKWWHLNDCKIDDAKTKELFGIT